MKRKDEIIAFARKYPDIVNMQSFECVVWLCMNVSHRGLKLA